MAKLISPSKLSAEIASALGLPANRTRGFSVHFPMHALAYVEAEILIESESSGELVTRFKRFHLVEHEDVTVLKKIDLPPPTTETVRRG